MPKYVTRRPLQFYIPVYVFPFFIDNLEHLKKTSSILQILIGRALLGYSLRICDE